MKKKSYQFLPLTVLAYYSLGFPSRFIFVFVFRICVCSSCFTAYYCSSYSSRVLLVYQAYFPNDADDDDDTPLSNIMYCLRQSIVLSFFIPPSFFLALQILHLISLLRLFSSIIFINRAPSYHFSVSGISFHLYTYTFCLILVVTLISPNTHPPIHPLLAQRFLSLCNDLYRYARIYFLFKALELVLSVRPSLSLSVSYVFFLDLV